MMPPIRPKSAPDDPTVVEQGFATADTKFPSKKARNNQLAEVDFT